MKKQLLLINLGLTVFTSSFASTPLFTALFSKMHKPSNVYIQQTQKIHEGHANFSGDWIGTCDYNPDEETAMKIEQSTDSSALKINNIEFPMDAISTSGSNVNSNIESTMVHLRWSEDGQQILVSTLAYYKPGNMALGEWPAYSNYKINHIYRRNFRR